MHIEQFREFCLSKKGVTETFPFDEHTLVFKVLDKMFALVPLEEPQFRVCLKCDPERSIELREEFDNITGAFHMNKLHWNSIIVDHRIPTKMLIELTHHSYDLVVAKMTKKNQALLKDL